MRTDDEVLQLVYGKAARLRTATRKRRQWASALFMILASVIAFRLVSVSDVRTKVAARQPSDAAPTLEMGTCGGDDQAFPADVVTGAAPDESVVFGDDPGMALRAFLDAGGDPGGGGFVWTGGEWLVLRRDEKFVQYGYRSPRGFAYANADLGPSGWKVSNYGTCHPRVVASSMWQIQGAADPTASYVTISFEPLTSCSGTVPTKADVTTTETDSEVGILVRLAPLKKPKPHPSTAQACVAGGAAPVQARVELKAPLGGRTLLNYGAIPHAPPAS